VVKGWASIAELETTLTRERVIDANEMLDALEEAEAKAHPPKPPSR
jgi:hypothetical protein